MDPTDSEDKVWEKCARRLLLNSGQSLQTLEATLVKVLRNIIDNQNETKYRTLRINNTSVKNAIIDAPGGSEFLVAAGFGHAVTDSGEKVLKFDDTHVEPLQHALEWLRNTCGTCKEFLLSNGKRQQAPCCDCEIQIRLPIGTSVTGGFMKGDTLQDVRNFVACYFTNER
jgi:hypothetical protein